MMDTIEFAIDVLDMLADDYAAKLNNPANRMANDWYMTAESELRKAMRAICAVAAIEAFANAGQLMRSTLAPTERPAPPTVGSSRYDLVTCDRCKGKGVFKCWNCTGSGETSDEYGNDHLCPTCKGDGTEDCLQCKGTGKMEVERVPAAPVAAVSDGDYDPHEGEGYLEDGWTKCVVCQAFTIDPDTGICIHWDKDIEHHEMWYEKPERVVAVYADDGTPRRLSADQKLRTDATPQPAADATAQRVRLSKAQRRLLECLDKHTGDYPLVPADFNSSATVAKVLVKHGFAKKAGFIVGMQSYVITPEGRAEARRR